MVVSFVHSTWEACKCFSQSVLGPWVASTVHALALELHRWQPPLSSLGSPRVQARAWGADWLDSTQGQEARLAAPALLSSKGFPPPFCLEELCNNPVIQCSVFHTLCPHEALWMRVKQSFPGPSLQGLKLTFQGRAGSPCIQ